MDRTIQIDRDLLFWGAQLTAADRVRQANVAMRFYLLVHQPYARPFIRGFSTLEEFFAFRLESDRQA